MATTEVQRQIIANVKAQSTVEVNTSQGWVQINDKNDHENSIFLQGEDGYAFIDKAKAMYDTNEDISLEDAYLFFADEYLVLFAE